ncbi:MAG: DNA cytosine methyltransferase, partial [Caulobacteraceae bacterium]|nr:DNA cytosine methyltransferase [Caulobacter sp.]
VAVEDGAVRTRKLTPREGARLMGLPDEHRLPAGATAALQVLGDGVCAPVVRWLAAHLLEPLLRGEALSGSREAA